MYTKNSEMAREGLSRNLGMKEIRRRDLFRFPSKMPGGVVESGG